MMGVAWWLSRPSTGGRQAAARPTAVSAPAPPNLPHEKAFLEEDLRKKPGHAPVLLRLAQVEREMGRLDEARKHLEQAVAGSENVIEARLELSRVSFELGDVTTALEQNRQVLRQDPKQADALYNLGAISANLGDLPQARKYWGEAVRSGSDTESGKRAAEALKKVSDPAMAR